MNLNDYMVNSNDSIFESVKKMDASGIGFCICIDDAETVVGVVSDGDFRRAILDGINLQSPVNKIMNSNFTYVTPNYSNREVEDIFSKGIVGHIPVIEEKVLKNIILRSGEFDVDRNNRKDLKLQVVIMAGGKGTRLDPFTRILPKPLIPLGKDPIIHVIMNEFILYGVKDFYVTLKEKSHMIKAYFHEHELDCKINFIEERNPLGTAGSLKLLNNDLDGSFFVSNCDIVIKTDYNLLYEFHQKNNYDLTIVGALRHHSIPYGVCHIKDGGDLDFMQEKPRYDLLTNTGLYVLNKDVLEYIPHDTYYDMDELIKKLQESGKKVGVFPVSSGSWTDVGQWNEYYEAVQKVKDEF